MEKHIVPLYNETKQAVLSDIRKGTQHAFMTDAWTSGVTHGFVTSIAHYLDGETMTLEAKVLDTKIIDEAHTGENLAAEMEETVTDWVLLNPMAVTDIATNVVKACALQEYWVFCAYHKFTC